MTMLGYEKAEDTKYSHKSSLRRFQLTHDIMITLGGKFLDSMSVLDWGCGPGNFFQFANDISDIPKNYLGLDIREDTLEFAKNRFSKFDNVRFEKPDTTVHGFDLCVGLGVLGVVSHVKSEKPEDCFHQDRMTLMNMWNASKILVFTLPKTWEGKTTMSLMRYSFESACAMIANTIKHVDKIIVDGATFDHEFVIGVSKK